MTDYEKYQLQWMIDHGHSLGDLMKELSCAQEDYCNAPAGEGLNPNASVLDVFNEWEYNVGFRGEIWACENEWAETEKTSKPDVQRILLSFGEGENERRLVAENNNMPEFGPEIVVGIADKNQNWLQDLAVIRVVKESCGPREGRLTTEVLLYEDEYDENYTSKRKIRLYPAEAEEISLPDENDGKISAQEALARSIQEHGKPDMMDMCVMTGLEEDEICDALKGIIYPVPGPANDYGYGEYVTAGEYLSGNPEELRDRLHKAEDAAEMSPCFDDNVVALQNQLCGMNFNTVDTKACTHVMTLGGWLDKNHIPHFDAEVFANLQYASDSVNFPGKKTLMIPSENGPMLIIEGKHFVIDHKK